MLFITLIVLFLLSELKTLYCFSNPIRGGSFYPLLLNRLSEFMPNPCMAF